MTPLACPNCGAPANVAPGQTIASCAYCQRSFQVQAPAPLATPPPQPVIQPIIVLAPGELPAQAVAVARRTRTGCGLVGALMPLLTLGFVGAVVYFSLGHAGALPTGAPGLLGGGWNGAEPLVCGGNAEVSATDVTASYTSGAAINAGGNCHVRCVRCRIKAPIAVLAGGNAQIELVDATLEATEHAVVAGGNGNVRILGNSTMHGDVVKSGNAEVTAPPPPTAPHAPATATSTATHTHH